MSYIRVIPRDLFNEANLLKCVGRVYLNLEKLGLTNVSLEHDGQAFDVRQEQSSGDIYLKNVRLFINNERYLHRDFVLRRPLNSRGLWPLYLTVGDYDDIPVLNESSGDFSPEMLEFLNQP